MNPQSGAKGRSTASPTSANAVAKKQYGLKVMHDTAFDIGQKFFAVYFPRRQPRILELGSLNVNGTLRDCAPHGSKYLGVDITAGPGVDVVLQDPYSLPFEDGRFDATISSSCFEHDQLFWLSFLEMVRVTKSSGYIYLNVPSNGPYHSYPFDNWRFYPDAGLALAAWAAHQGKTVTLVESFIAGRKGDLWNDCVIVFRKGPIARRTLPKEKLSDAVHPCFNVRSHNTNEVVNLTAESEDRQLLLQTKQTLVDREQERDKLTETIDETRVNLASVAAEFTSAKATLAATQEDAARQRGELEAALGETRGRIASMINESDELIRERDQLVAAFEEQVAAATKLRTDLDTVQSEANNRKDEIDKLSSALRSEQSAIRDRDREFERLSRDMDATRLFLRESQAEIQRLAGERDNAQAEAVRAIAEHRRVSEEHLLAAAQFTVAREEIAALNGALKSARQETDGRGERINDLARDLRVAAAQAALAEEALLAVAREKDELAIALAAHMRTSREDAAAQALRTSGEKERLASELAKAAESKNEAQGQILTLRDQLVDAEAALARAKRTGRDGAAWMRFFSLSKRRAARQLMKSGLFDAEWYLREYPDAAASGRSPVEHYLEEGYLRGYRPNPFFDTHWYLEHYEDVRRAGVNPLLHYMQHGFRESRNPGPKFQTDFYLETNPDVRSQDVNPLAHYLRHGRHEGRLPTRPT